MLIDRERSLSESVKDDSHQILFIGANDPPLTGGDIYNMKIVEYLRRTHSVETLSIDAIPEQIRKDYVACNRWLLNRYGARLAHLTIIQDYYWHPRAFIFNRIARWKGARQIGVVHHLYHYFLTGKWRQVADQWVAWASLSAMDEIIVNSQNTRDETRKLGVKNKPFHIVFPGYDQLPDPVTLDLTGDRPLRLLTVGSTDPRKGYDTLIEALAHVNYNFELEIVGNAHYDESYRRRLDAIISEYDLGSRIHWRGRLSAEQLRRAHQRADIFVAPSRWEGFGMAIFEALLYGLPVVSTDVGAIPELIGHEREGLLVSSGDGVALAEALDQLAARPELRQQLAEAGRKKALTLHNTWEQVGEKAAIAVMTANSRR